MATYESQLQLPLVGFTADELWSYACAVLEPDDRVLMVERESRVVGLEAGDQVEEVEHLSVVVRFEATSNHDARQVAGALHDAALGRVLKLMPSSEPNRGWTTSFGEPVRLPE